MLEAVAARIRNRENPENAAIAETAVQDWRLDVARGVASELRKSVKDRMDDLSPSTRTLSADEEKKINETYDKIEALFESVTVPVRR